jgi:UDP-N-acetylmuramoylalanine--D-glutamate ligase
MTSSSISLQTRDIAVVGLGISGLSTLEWCAKQGIITRAFDDDLSKQNEAEKIGALWTPPHKGLLENAEALVLSPGIPLSHPIAQQAKKHNIPIISDVEIFAQSYPSTTVIAVSGTNGKSTLVTLISHLLNAFSHRAVASGNIGLPVLDLHMETRPIVVLELSSFQLERCPSLAPHISVITNITPDHLEHHASEKNYRHAKLQLFRQTRKSGVILVDPSIAQDHDTIEVLDAKKDNTLQLSLNPPTPSAHGFQILVPGGNTLTLPPQCPLNGRAGAALVALALAAVAAYDPAPFLSQTQNSTILNHINAFPTLPHRQEFIPSDKKIFIINDSKATNPEATAAALERFNHIFWIAGGQDKNTSLKPIASHLHNIQSVYLIGNAAPRIESFLKKHPNHPKITHCQSLENATEIALHHAEIFSQTHPSLHATLLLSPLCSSFDQFKNFQHRGNVFKQSILKYSSSSHVK